MTNIFNKTHDYNNASKNYFLRWCSIAMVVLATSTYVEASYTNEIFAGTYDSAGYSGDGGAATSAILGGGIRGICLDSSNNLYIADANNNAIRKVNASDGHISTLVSGLSNPFGVYVDSSGDIYVSNFNSGTVGKYDSSGSAINASLISGLSSPFGICLDNTGNIYVATNGGCKVGKYDSSGSAINASLISGLSGPTGVYVDSLGNIYVADTAYGWGAIKKYDSSGSSLNSDLIPGVKVPNGIFVDSSDNVYVGDTGNSSLKMFSASDSSITTIVSGLNGPSGVCVDSSDNIYVAESGKHVIRKLIPPSASLTIQVDGTNSATISAPLAVAILHKTGTGTAILSGDNSSLSTLSIDVGLVKVSATENMGNALTFAGGNLEITSGTVAIPTAAVNSDATITVDSGASITIAPHSGVGTLTIAGDGAVDVGDLSSTSAPFAVSGIMEIGASSSNKLSSGPITVKNGGLLKVMGAFAGSIPGDAEVKSGATLEINGGVAVPADTGADIFGTLKFDSGATLKLGANSSWARDITVDTIL